MAQAMLNNSINVESSKSNCSMVSVANSRSGQNSAMSSKSDGKLNNGQKNKKCRKKKGHPSKKKHLSSRSLHLMSLSKAQKRRLFRTKKYRIHPPTKFLLGGNIHDPLNLNSLNDDRINRLLNEKTPVTSPMPTPSFRKQVNVIIPKDIQDPLNLNVSDDRNAKIWRDIAKRRKKFKRRKPADGGKNEVEKSNEVDSSVKPLNVEVSQSVSTSASARKPKRCPANEIVSPAVPQFSKPRRKRTVSEGSRAAGEGEGQSDTKKHKKEDTNKKKQQTPHAKKNQQSAATQRQQTEGSNKKKKRNEQQFIYGNYNRYYSKRNADVEDERLKLLKKHGFEGKEVLDIGCNAGDITLSVARDFGPTKVVGIDIDPKLITVARKNVKHYLSKDVLGGRSVPLSFAINYGPAYAGQIPETPEDARVFPNNIHFMQVCIVICDFKLIFKLTSRRFISGIFVVGELRSR